MAATRKKPVAQKIPRKPTPKPRKAKRAALKAANRSVIQQDHRPLVTVQITIIALLVVVFAILVITKFYK